jgi:CheY-like chemotaxis protein
MSKLNGVAILVVEDSAEVNAMLQRFLEADGATVEVVLNGKEAVAAVARKDFDLILMDIQMPVMDGYLATQNIRIQGFRRPIIAVTALAKEEDRHRAIEAGCDAHVIKPISRELLLEVVRRYLRR